MNHIVAAHLKLQLATLCLMQHRNVIWQVLEDTRERLHLSHTQIKPLLLSNIYLLHRVLGHLGASGAL